VASALARSIKRARWASEYCPAGKWMTVEAPAKKCGCSAASDYSQIGDGVQVPLPQVAAAASQG
jgi:hypothetical protein